MSATLPANHTTCERILDKAEVDGDSPSVPLTAFGAWGLGFVWGALTGRISVRRHILVDTAWLLGSTAAVAAAAAVVTADLWTAAHVAGAAIAGWLTRRILEAIVEGRLWT
jgi:hypothetical protein